MAQIYQDPIVINEDAGIHQACSVGKFSWNNKRMYGSTGCDNRFGQTILIDLLAQCHTNIYANSGRQLELQSAHHHFNHANTVARITLQGFADYHTRLISSHI